MNIFVLAKNKQRRELIHSVCEFYSNELKLQKSKYSLVVRLIPKMTKDQGIHGGVSQCENKILEMLLDSSMRFDMMISTIAHEMIHVKQYAKGQLKARLKSNNKTEFKWLGKVYKEKNYYDNPWEIDAFRNEKLLLNKLLKILVDKNKKP